MIKQDITPTNNKGQRNGLWLVYYPNNILVKGQFINSIQYGYWMNNWNNIITLHLK